MVFHHVPWMNLINGPLPPPQTSIYQSFPLRFLPVYFVSGLTSRPFRRLRSFFSMIQSRLLLADFPPRSFFILSLKKKPPETIWKKSCKQVVPHLFASFFAWLLCPASSVSAFGRGWWPPVFSTKKYLPNDWEES